MTNAESNRQKLINLRKLLIKHFDLGELRVLCFDLGLDYEELAGKTKTTKMQDLITYFERRGDLQRLLDEVNSQRPNVAWPEFAPTTEDKAADTKTDLEKNRRESVTGDQVGGDKITAGDISDVQGASIGEKAQGLSAGDVSGSVIQAQGDVTLGRSHRDEQYEVALNWDGRRRMRGYDLAKRDLSGLNLANSDLRRADLRGADLSDTDLSGADLSGANLVEINLSGTTYTKLTRWPDEFDPKTAGAILDSQEDTTSANPYTMTRPILSYDKPRFTKGTTVNTYTDDKTGLEMVRIPAGEFIYGQGDRLEYLPDYWISKTPVTNAQYLRFVRETGHDSPERWEGKTPKAHIADHPVVYVNWHDAEAYADWAGMHLPIEKEWEKAARGTDGRIYPWGNEWIGESCNTSEASIGETTPVGRFSPQGDSPYGCVDMAGNVWEWTASWYDDEENLRVLRGGSWSNVQYAARAVYRRNLRPGLRGSNGSFRVVVRRPPSR